MKAYQKLMRVIYQLLLTFCVVIFLFPSASIKASQLKTIRVGYFAFEGYHQIDANGERSGYGYDFLQYLSGYTNWHYEYVGYDQSWSDMQDMLANGQIDILTSAQKTKQREQRFDFSTRSIGVSSAILTVKVGNTAYVKNDYSTWNGIRIGMLNGNSRNNDLVNLAKEKGFNYLPVYFDDTVSLINELKNGTLIDAALTSDLRAIQNEWIIAKFAPSDYYIMVQKGNATLLNEINTALEQLLTDHPTIPDQLYNKYYQPESGDEIAFTPTERDFIRANKDTVFTAIVNPDCQPLSYYSNGQLLGIIPSIASEIIKRSGLNISFIETTSRQDYQQKIQNQIADIRFDAWNNFSISESFGYRLTEPYMDVAISRLSLSGTTTFNTIGLLTNSDMSDKYLEHFKKMLCKSFSLILLKVWLMRFLTKKLMPVTYIL